MFYPGDRVIYSMENHKIYGFIGTIVKLNKQELGKRWYTVEWDNKYRGIMGYYEKNLSLYDPTPDWEL